MADEYQLRKDIDKIYFRVYDVENDRLLVYTKDEMNALLDANYFDQSEVLTLINESGGGGGSGTDLQLELVPKSENSDGVICIKGGNVNYDLDKVYPVGSIYMSVNSTNPSTLFGGIWEQLTDTFLYATSTTADDNVTTAPSGQGSSTVTLTANQSGIRAHGHGMSHTHSHTHISSSYESKRSASGTAQPVPRGRSNTDKTGDFTSDTDATPSSKSTTDNNTAQNATEAHNNMPPYMKVFMWKRVQ